MAGPGGSYRYFDDEDEDDLEGVYKTIVIKYENIYLLIYLFWEFCYSEFYVSPSMAGLEKDLLLVAEGPIPSLYTVLCTGTKVETSSFLPGVHSV